MLVGIAGAGAVGAHYGVRLQQAGLNVQMLARGEHAKVMQEQGLRYRSEGVEQYLTVQVSDDPICLHACNVILFACKTTQLAAMCTALQEKITDDTVLISMQNGVTAADEIATAFPANPILAASAFIGARLQAPGYLIHSAAGHLRLGLWHCEEQQQHVEAVIETLLAAWQRATVDARQVGDMSSMLWHKMLWNCGFNAITALTRRYARDVLEDEKGRKIVLAAMQETLTVAQAEGATIDESHIEQHIQLTQGAGAVKTSMWQDVEHHRTTEIHAMNGHVVAMGKKHGIATPVNQMLCHLIILAERGYM